MTVKAKPSSCSATPLNKGGFYRSINSHCSNIIEENRKKLMHARHSVDFDSAQIFGSSGLTMNE